MPGVRMVADCQRVGIGILRSSPLRNKWALYRRHLTIRRHPDPAADIAEYVVVQNFYTEVPRPSGLAGEHGHGHADWREALALATGRKL